MAVICLNCDGWGCAQCKNEREAAQGGEQGPNALEVELAGLRVQLAEVTADRDRLVAEIALLRVPGGAA